MMDLRRWLEFLFPSRMDEAVLENISSDDFLARISPRLVSGTRPETIALLSFTDRPVRAAIHEAKYRESKRAFELLACALAEYLCDSDDLPRKALIVPVPLGARRRKERGFNQIEEIARRAAGALGIKVDTALLKRTRETESQVSLPRHAREENMRGAFGAPHPLNPVYTYIVIDDVITTGATLQATIDALREAGAKHIIPLALAH